MSPLPANGRILDNLNEVLSIRAQEYSSNPRICRASGYLNEVLSIRAQELSNFSSIVRGFSNLNEVLSIRAQECVRVDVFHGFDEITSMKS